MNRQEAIEILTGRYLIPVEDGADEHAERVNKALDLAIDALNIIEQLRWERDTALQTLEEHGIGLGQKSDWIPVSERLPEVGQDVLASVHVDYAEHAVIINRYEEQPSWSNGIITAWRPLPEPYKAESEEV